MLPLFAGITLPSAQAQSYSEVASLSSPGANPNLVWGDHNQDGTLDLAVVGKGNSAVYTGDGSGGFSETFSFERLDNGAADWGDFDRDGDLDLVVTGFEPGQGPVTKIYENTGGGTFSSVGAGIVGLSDGSPSWGDYDKDGDLDLLVSGIDDAGTNVTRVYRNDGGGTFVQALDGGQQGGPSAWGDFDGDGDLDFIVTGFYSPLSVVWQNLGDTDGDGKTEFGKMGNSIPGVQDGAVAWGDADADGIVELAILGNDGTAPPLRVFDYENGGFVEEDVVAGSERGSVDWGDADNDGDLDLLVTGFNGEVKLTSVYTNDGDGTSFSFAADPFPAVSDGRAAFGDYDDDGTLDVAVAGASGNGSILEVWKGSAGRTNRPPQAPSNLTTSLDGLDRTLEIGWQPASDRAPNGTGGQPTPTSALTYNVYLRPQGSSDFLRTPEADPASGRRWGGRRGNAASQTSLSLDPSTLSEGTYEWSAQSLDYNYAGSSFPSAGTFTISRTDLALSADFTDPAIPRDSPTTVTLTLSNGGSSASAGGSEVSVDVPSGLGVIGSTGDGSYVNGTWTVNTPISSGGSATMTLTVQPDETADQTLTAELTASETLDTDPSNHTAQTVVERDPAMTIHVDAGATGANDGRSWNNAFNTLQDALDHATRNDQIWIAEGVYTPDPDGTDRRASFHITGNIDGVEVYGGFKSGDQNLSDRSPADHPVILSGDIDGNDALSGNSYHVVVVDGGDAVGADVTANVTTETVLAGVTITGGNADGSDNAGAGGGLFCDGRGSGNECSPMIRGVTFTGNSAFLNGGAINNDGFDNGTSSPQITGSTFTGNSANFGGAIYNDGFDNGTSSPQITGSTFTGNSASFDGGAILSNGRFGGTSRPQVTNTILWGNTAGSDGDEVQSVGATPTLAHTLIEGGLSGIGEEIGSSTTDGGDNLSADPQFADASNPAGADGIPATDDDGLLLTTGSPALDAGDNSAIPSGVTTDITGADRIQDRDGDGTATVNIGAYEVVNAAPSLALSTTTPSLQENSSTPATVASITINDDNTGTNNLSLSGADAGDFGLSGTDLQFIGTADFETKSSYDVTVEVNDNNVGSDPNDSEAVTLSITDVNEAPAVALGSTSGSIDENNSPPTVLTTITVSDDALGTNDLTLSGADAGAFAINGSNELEFTETADFESESSYSVTVEVNDSSVGTDPNDSETFSLSINDVNDAPTVALGTTSGAIDEGNSPPTVLTSITVSDPDGGTNDLSLSGADAGAFAISGSNELEFTETADFESESSYSVTVEVNDSSVGSDPNDSETFSLSINDVNEAPAVALSPTSASIPEDTDTSSPVTLSTITVSDDAPGTNDLVLSGADASSFAISGTDLQLKSGTTLNADNKTTYDVTVEVNDTAVGSDPDDTAAFALTVTDVNSAPSLTLSTTTPSLQENSSTPATVASITINDDETGTNNLSLSGAGSDDFGLSGTDLQFTGTADFETKSSYDVTVEVNDAAVGSDPDDSEAVTLSITDVNEAPAVALSPTNASIPEDTDTSSPVTLSTITVSDDAPGTNDLALSGADASSFAISGTDLQLKSGTTLNADTKTSYDVTVEVNDTAVGPDPDDTAAFALTVTDVNSAPSLTLSTTTPSLQENSSTPATVASITINDDETGTNTLSLSGADSDDFGLSGTDLQFTGTADFETKSSYDVTVEVNDSSVGSDPDDSEGVTLSITNVNEAPVVATNTGLTLDEGATQTIGTGALSATDEDAGDGAPRLTFSVTSGPANGTLLVGGTSASSFTQKDLADGIVEYQHDGSETSSGDFTFALTDDEGAGPTGQTFAITVNAQNDAPTISALSDQTIEEDGTLGPVSFTVGDAETAASSLTVTAASGDQTLVPDANIALGGSDGSRTIGVTPAANQSGTATITVTVDDGAGSNNTATASFTLTVEPVVDLTLTDGSSGGLNFDAEVSPGTADNPIGAFQLAAGQSGAVFDGVTVTNRASGVSGITSARLYLSADPSLEPGEDTPVASFDVDDASAEATIPFTGIGQLIPTSGYYAIVAIDVAAGATAGGVQFELAQASDLSVSGDETVAGAEVAMITGAASAPYPLSNGTTALPVEFAGFDATADGRESVNLRWQTASETNNAGFRVERRGEGGTGRRGDWVEVGSVDGAGTTTKVQSYVFTDEGVPYDADSLTYRLKQVDVDGSVSYSEARTVARSGVEAVQLLGTYPNPARSRATVRFAVPEGSAAGSGEGVTLHLYDVLGRQVRTVRSGAEAGRHELQLDTGGLASGTYFLRLTAGGTIRTQKLTVVR